MTEIKLETDELNTLAKQMTNESEVFSKRNDKIGDYAAELTVNCAFARLGRIYDMIEEVSAMGSKRADELKELANKAFKVQADFTKADHKVTSIKSSSKVLTKDEAEKYLEGGILGSGLYSSYDKNIKISKLPKTLTYKDKGHTYVYKLRKHIETFLGCKLAFNGEYNYERVYSDEPKVSYGIIFGGKGEGEVNSKEILLDTASSHDSARKILIDELDLTGNFKNGSNSYQGRLKSSYGYKKQIGRQSLDGKVRWRLDFDEKIGIHYNIEDFSKGKGVNAVKKIIPIDILEKEYKEIINLWNK
ncbi:MULTISPECIES: hypothetical protein [Clostridium]|uniref:hypothetical protein n=1 Tax=Clostridium TaxID=1485 RepID=UPI0008267161|nr:MULTISPECIES: hypothetical protein [Clostridium]PJI09337.1 hypothetical protein CUB90_16275 [Clostridium sp. CT7]